MSNVEFYMDTTETKIEKQFLSKRELDVLRGEGRFGYLFAPSFLLLKKMLKSILNKNLLYKPSIVRQLCTNLPKYNGEKVFNNREKAAEGIWARQMVRYILKI